MTFATITYVTKTSCCSKQDGGGGVRRGGQTAVHAAPRRPQRRAAPHDRALRVQGKVQHNTGLQEKLSDEFKLQHDVPRLLLADDRHVISAGLRSLDVYERADGAHRIR